MKAIDSALTGSKLAERSENTREELEEQQREIRENNTKMLKKAIGKAEALDTQMQDLALI